MAFPGPVHKGTLPVPIRILKTKSLKINEFQNNILYGKRAGVARLADAGATRVGSAGPCLGLKWGPLLAENVVQLIVLVIYC